MTSTSSHEITLLSEAYDRFNEQLWNGALPDVFITLQVHSGAYGYFHAEQFIEREGGSQHQHELALNPATFEGRTDLEILSTLVHEMCHVWQQDFGKPAKNAYHNKQWATEMKRIGLKPYNVKNPDKETGAACSHTIDKNSIFFVCVANELINGGWRLNWNKRPDTKPEKKRKKATKRSKCKFSCPVCEANAWGKPDSRIMCGTCFENESAARMMIRDVEPEDVQEAYNVLVHGAIQTMQTILANSTSPAELDERVKTGHYDSLIHMSIEYWISEMKRSRNTFESLACAVYSELRDEQNDELDAAIQNPPSSGKCEIEEDEAEELAEKLAPIPYTSLIL